MQSRNRKIVNIFITVALVVLFGIAYRSVLNTFQKESQLNEYDALFKLGTQVTDGVAVSCRIVSVDPSTRLMTMRLELTPLGAYSLPDGSLKDPLRVEVSSVEGRMEFDFKGQQLASPLSFSTSLVGAPTEYPFDHQQGHIEVSLKSQPIADTWLPVPLVVGGNAQVTGLALSQGRNFDLARKRVLPEFGPGFFSVTIEVARSATVIAFAVFVMAIQWLMAAVALLVALEVVLGGRKADSPMFSWMTAMLFALPPMRNIMVGVPPIGVLSDYLAFLWCEGLIALCLTAIVLAWLIRRPRLENL